MTKNERLRRVALLCCHLTRNLAYYHAGWKVMQPRKEGDFWLTVLGNFIDISILEWSKLFGDHNGKHHWKQMVPDEEAFKLKLLNSLGITQTEWDQSWESIKNYRDKFIAHLDSDHTMNVPHMDIPHRMVTFYYNEVRLLCDTNEVLYDLPIDMSVYFQACYQDASEVFKHNSHSHSS